MSVTYVVGIDPGLVHTGVVHMAFDDAAKTLTIGSSIVLEPNAEVTRATVYRRTRPHPDHVFVEDYRTRSSFNTDAKMREFVQDLKRALPKATFLDNMGVKQVVKRELMQLLGVWNFSTPTHHQDLRSAARIALFGMLKDDELNRLLADVVLDTMFNGRPWTHAALGTGTTGSDRPV